jgi:tripartite-type tricarboxylate transporter receptor subunit TctC
MGMGSLKHGSFRSSTFLVGTLALLLSTSGARAQQQFPTQPIRLIVPAAADSVLDLVARALALQLTEAFKQPVVVDNRPGNSGIVGTEIALRANPDGYTVLLVPSTYGASAAFRNLPYDSLNDVTPIALFGQSGFVVTLHPSLPITSVRELIAHDKANPGGLHYGAAGTGSGSHRSAELFNYMAGTTITNVPYKGQGLALNDLLSGQIQMFFGNLPTMIPQIKANRLRGIAVTTATRSHAVPDIPTVGETVAGYEAVGWQGVLGPRALPKNIVARWNNEINRILQLSELKERLAADGIAPAGGSSEQFREFLQREIAKWQMVVKSTGIKPQS